MKKKPAVQYITGLTVLLLLSMVLTGCGRERKWTGRDSAYSYGSSGYMAEVAEEPDYMSSPEGAAADEEALYKTAPSAGTVLRAPESASDKLIYSGSITLQTLEYEKTMESIHSRIESAGGFVQYEDESDGNETWYYSGSSRSVPRRHAMIQARIPSEQFSVFLDGVAEDGQVMNRFVNADNISQTYAETEASVQAYEIEQERLLEMMDKAETIEDMIAVEARLSEVEAELSRYKTSLASMDRDVEYSSVTVNVDEVREYTEEKDDSTFISRLKETVRDSWDGFLWFMEGLLHVVIRLVPFLIVILVIVLIVRAVNKKLEGKRRARKARKLEKKAQKAMERSKEYAQRYPGSMQQTPPPGIQQTRSQIPAQTETKTGKDPDPK